MKIIIGGLIEKEGKFLLVQEAKKDIQKWNLPSGHLESQENILAGAVREIKEETGFSVSLDNILLIGQDQDNDVLIIIFKSSVLGEPSFYNKDEILNIYWFSYEEILEMDFRLRFPVLIKNVLNNYRNNINSSLDIIQKII